MWNLDETNVDPDLGKKIKVLCDSSTHHGGSRPAGGGSGRHVTAVVAASASGKVCPPVFIIQGKQVMSNWFQPLEMALYTRNTTTVIDGLNEKGWFPQDGVVVCTEKGSMECPSSLFL